MGQGDGCKIFKTSKGVRANGGDSLRDFCGGTTRYQCVAGRLDDGIAIVSGVKHGVVLVNNDRSKTVTAINKRPMISVLILIFYTDNAFGNKELRK